MPNETVPGHGLYRLSEEVWAAEQQYIRSWRNADRAGRPLTGLALSGGGIRSAVYCLGVLQALAKYGILERFDYLSTVSGGGYIASSLTWCTSRASAERLHAGKREPFGVRADNLPFDIEDPLAAVRKPARPASLLRHLRRHASYLLPGHGIDVVSGVAVVLRGLLLNLVVVWLPVLTFLFAVGLLVAQQLHSHEATAWVLPWLHPLSLAGYCMAAFVGWSMLYSLQSHRKPGSSGRGIPYTKRRMFETKASWLLRFTAGFMVVGSLAIVTSIVHVRVLQNGGVVGALMAASGALSGVWSRFVPKGKVADRVPGWVGPVGAALVFYGIGLLAYWLAEQWVSDWILGIAGWLTLEGLVRPTLSFAAAGCVFAVPPLVAVVIGWWVDLNYTTLHRYYRDRLMEAFMPDLTVMGIPTGPMARQAESGRLQDMCDVEAAAGPYHILNAHMVITHVDDTPPPRQSTPEDEALQEAADRLRLRGGDSFILSPRYCGSRVTGWQPTAQFMSGKLTLATAMAISGAAVNPDAASAGVGPERNWTFAALMSLLNIRLGFWAPNPILKGRDPLPNHFVPGLSSCIDRLRVKGRLVELTDGGHYDNLGVYELLRRNVQVIVACDADADPNFAFADLQTLLSRAAADFDVRIEFVSPPALGSLMPRDTPAGTYPHGVMLSESPFAVADVTYANGDKGKLYYLKAALTASLRLQLLGFKGANPEFPDDPTIDQFFSEARFEAYRELGFASTEAMLGEGKSAIALALLAM